MTAITILKQWFANFKKPTQEHFWAWIDSFWHKSEKIPMANIEGLESLVEGTASAEQLRNHLTDTHAHKEVLDKKVDKVAGKKLSTEDFTTELRRKLEALEQVDISGLLPKGGYTGTAQDLKKLIDNLTRILQSPDTELDELREIVAYIKQNKHILSTLGISNIAGLEDALAAKADKDHNHDERYAPKVHHHNEYAHRTHRHNWDDIDGKPNNLATTDSVKSAVEGIQIGGRNYVLKSGEKRTSVGYIGQYWNFSETMIIGKQYTLSCYVSENYSKLHIYFIDVTGQPRQYITTELKDGYNEVTVIPKYAWTGLCAYHEVKGVTPAPTVAIEKVKLERGNKATDWSPAPEDFITPEEVMRKITRTGYEVGTDTVIPQAQQNDTVFVKASCTLGLQNIEHLGSLSLIKTFDTGAVIFTCAGKNIIYPFDNTFNGKKGSTAVVSIHNNDCYIRISNV